MTDQERLVEIKASPDLTAALELHMDKVIGHKLFTIMVVDHETNEAARVYSSNSEAYPVKGRKPLGELTAWGAQVLQAGEPFIANTAEGIAEVFPDHELIASLGCASVLNVPVHGADGVLGTMNLLHEAGWYRPEHAARAAPFAALLAPTLAELE